MFFRVPRDDSVLHDSVLQDSELQDSELQDSELQDDIRPTCSKREASWNQTDNSNYFLDKEHCQSNVTDSEILYFHSPIHFAPSNCLLQLPNTSDIML